MSELPEQGAIGLGIARVEFPHLRVQQVVEKKRPAGHPSVFILHPFYAAPPFGFFSGHNRPTDGLGVGEDPSLDCFVFARLAHGFKLGAPLLQ
jgi:hypothetical protein